MTGLVEEWHPSALVGVGMAVSGVTVLAVVAVAEVGVMDVVIVSSLHLP